MPKKSSLPKITGGAVHNTSVVKKPVNRTRIDLNKAIPTRSEKRTLSLIKKHGHYRGSYSTENGTAHMAFPYSVKDKGVTVKRLIQLRRGTLDRTPRKKK